VTFAGKKGDRLAIATPGGGGFGDEVRASFWAKVLTGDLHSLS
jgi:N-methylhydantoinase B/oxoprolinase/acetone carboxylase alpha subunit